MELKFSKIVQVQYIVFRHFVKEMLTLLDNC